MAGSLLSTNYLCSYGHSDVWHSQPLLRKMEAGNLMLSCAGLFSGISYVRFKDGADCIHFHVVEVNIIPCNQTIYFLSFMITSQHRRQK